MKPGTKLTFIVTAMPQAVKKGSGEDSPKYLPSLPATFEYVVSNRKPRAKSQKLETPVLSMESQDLIWKSIDNAQKYEVTITSILPSGEEAPKKQIVTETKFPLPLTFPPGTKLRLEVVALPEIPEEGKSPKFLSSDPGKFECEVLSDLKFQPVEPEPTP